MIKKERKRKIEPKIKKNLPSRCKAVCGNRLALGNCGSLLKSVSSLPVRVR